jgi:Catalase
MRFLFALLRWVAAFAVLGLIFVMGGFAWSYYIGDRAPKSAPMIEKIDKNENFYTSQIIESAIALSMGSRDQLIQSSKDSTIALDAKGHLITSAKTDPGFQTSTFRRDVHSKSHGCVNATFQVASDIPDRFAWGIFAHPNQKFQAIIRFSNGKPSLNSDGVPDARGFAMKLLDVPGKKLLDFEKDDDTQDFIMINSKVFFIRTIEEYAAFSSALGQGNAAVVKYFFPSLAPSTWHAREFILANSSFKQRPESLVTEQYYSLSAYKLGPSEYVKYSVRPCPENAPLRPPYASAPWFLSRMWKKLLWPYASLSATSMDPETYHDYLRQELSNQSNRGGACFDFLVQEQVAEKNMPIEDATVEWDEKISPFVRVGRVTINAGADNTADANRTCEALSFNPWHALPEHEPVGVMNRVRKALYQSMGNYRRTKNCQQFCRSGCDAGADGQSCKSGCYGSCMDKCPLLNEPATEGLPFPPNACQSVAKAVTTETTTAPTASAAPGAQGAPGGAK